MININDLNQLKKYGINFLTAESCAYSLRLLLDLNEDGVKIVSRWLGGNVNFRDGSNWNPRVGDKPAVASILLSREAIDNLITFILYDVEKCYAIQIDRYGQSGVTRKEFDRLSDDQKKDFRINWALESDNVKNGRNVHQFTGRHK